MAIPRLQGFMVEEAKTCTFAKVPFSVNSLLTLSLVQSLGLWKTHFVLSTAGIFPSLTGFSHLRWDSPQWPYLIALTDPGSSALCSELKRVGRKLPCRRGDHSLDSGLLRSPLVSSPLAHPLFYPMNPFSPVPGLQESLDMALLFLLNPETTGPLGLNSCSFWLLYFMIYSHQSPLRLVKREASVSIALGPNLRLRWTF